jgi:serine/threonine protein kinase
VLYELAAGRHAFPADSPVDALHAILTKQPAALSSVNPSMPSALGSLILAMLAKEPAARPSAEERDPLGPFNQVVNIMFVGRRKGLRKNFVFERT